MRKLYLWTYSLFPFLVFSFNRYWLWDYACAICNNQPAYSLIFLSCSFLLSVCQANLPLHAGLTLCLTCFWYLTAGDHKIILLYQLCGNTVRRLLSHFHVCTAEGFNPSLIDLSENHLTICHFRFCRSLNWNMIYGKVPCQAKETFLMVYCKVH